MYDDYPDSTSDKLTHSKFEEIVISSSVIGLLFGSLLVLIIFG